MNLSEIAIAYGNCNGEVARSFKNYIIDLELSPEQIKNGIIVSDCNNYILRDIEVLLSKAIINVCCADLLLKKGYFCWGFVTSYYSNFYSMQTLNRLKLNFDMWITSGLECQNKDYLNQQLFIKASNRSTGNHELQFQKFYDNYSDFKEIESIDRYWNIGLRKFKFKDESHLRNDINYSIENDYYYELKINYNDFKKIIVDNKNDPSKKSPKIKNPVNYSISNIELALARVRITLYILNYISNTNLDYKNYFIRHCESRKKSIAERYSNLSNWIFSLLEQWLQFVEIDTEDTLN